LTNVRRTAITAAHWPPVSVGKQPIMVITASTEHSYWLTLAFVAWNATVCVSCGFCLRNARNASDCVWMETRLKS